MTMKANIPTHHRSTSNTISPVQVASGDNTEQSSLIKKQQLARLLSVSPRTIDKWVEKRLIPFIQFSPGFNRFEIEAVMEVIREKFLIRPINRS